MSNILATVGRNVQYIDPQGNTLAAIITKVNPVQLAVFGNTVGVTYIDDAKEYNPNDRAAQSKVFKLTWQGR
jgi:hypothetical protein